MNSDVPFDFKSLQLKDISPLWSGFAPILSRELPFAIAKFLVFDVLATTAVAFLNSQNAEGSLPIQIGVGPSGLAVSAFSGAFAGIGSFQHDIEVVRFLKFFLYLSRQTILFPIVKLVQLFRTRLI